MSLTLYGFGPSRSLRCLWALEEAGLDYKLVELNLLSDQADGSQTDTYRAMNPQGKVPTLKHDDFVLTESAAILNYIDTLSEQNFIPNDSAQARAKYDELSYFVLSELEQPLWTTGKHKFAIPEQYRVSDIFLTTVWEFEKALNTLDAMVDYSGYLLSDQFSFADILVAQTLNWAERFKFQISDQHQAYRDRLFERPACKKALAIADI